MSIYIMSFNTAITRISDFIKEENNIWMHKNDTNRYHIHRSDNGMQIFFIENAKSRISSAHMYVCVGSYDNPPNLPGMAHFLEHMLFMGSDLYPGESFFQSELAKYGGITNAFTTDNSTQYYFTVGENFINILKIFSRFFVKPLLDAVWVEKEVNAVDSEHKKNISSDTWRIHAEERKLFLDREHKQFSTGTTELLLGACDNDSHVLCGELRKFYEKYYSADRMVLFVSHHTIDRSFIDTVIGQFAMVPRRKPIRCVCDTMNGRFAETPNKYELIVIKKNNKGHGMMFRWMIDNQEQYSDNLSVSGAQILTYIFGSERSGSLINGLVKRQLIHGASCGIEQTFYKNSVFGINMDLTEKGYRYWEVVIYFVLSYIKKISGYNIEWFRKKADEIERISLLVFKMADMMYGHDLVQYCADTWGTSKIDLRYLMISRILNHPMQANTCQRIVRNMTFNMKIIIASSDVTVSRRFIRDKHYGTEAFHTTRRISNDAHNVCTDNFYLIFGHAPTHTIIPTTSDIRSMKIYHPLSDLAENKSYHRIYPSDTETCIDKKGIYYVRANNGYDTYNVCATIFIELYEMQNKSSDIYVQMIMYILYVQKTKNTELFMYGLCGYDIMFMVTETGLLIKINGQPINISRVFDTVAGWYFENNDPIDITVYKNIYDDLMLRYTNTQLDTPFRRVGSEFKKMLNAKNTLSVEQLIVSLKRISPDIMCPDKCMAAIRRIISNGFIRGVFGGSFDSQAIRHIIRSIERYAGNDTNTKNYFTKKTVHIKKHTKTIRHKNPENKENAFGYGLYVGNACTDNLEQWAEITLYGWIINAIIGEKFTSNIRTRQEVGYVAYSQILNVGEKNNAELFLVFVVQSSRSDLLNIVGTYTDTQMIEDVRQTTDDEYDSIVRSILIRLKEKFQNIYEDINNASHVLTSTFIRHPAITTFDTKRILHDHMMRGTITRHSVITFVSRMLAAERSWIFIRAANT